MPSSSTTRAERTSLGPLSVPERQYHSDEIEAIEIPVITSIEGVAAGGGNEPMAGMGIEDSATLSKMLLAMKGTVAMLLVEHDMNAVFALADCISVLVCGRVVLLDEATEGLAPLVRHEIWSAIGSLRDRGFAIVIVDKNLRDVARLAERRVVLEKGLIAWTGLSSTLCGDAELQRRHLGL